MTAAELAAVGESIMALLEPYAARGTNPELLPAGSRAVSYVHYAVPYPTDP